MVPSQICFRCAKMGTPSIKHLNTHFVSIHHRYDLSLDEMRTLTLQRVKFTMGLPLLKRAIQEQVRFIVILVCVSE